MTTAQTFLTTLFSSKPEDQTILVWTAPDKVSGWFNLPETAADYALNLNSQNVYFGCATSPDPLILLPKYQKQANQKGARVPANIGEIRCKADDTLGIAGVWADIDIATPHHKKTNLPENMQQVNEIFEAIEIAPTFVLHTGGGVQGWWLFNEFWDFSQHQSGRDEAKMLLQRWQEWCKKCISDYGIDVAGQPFDMDSTHDLARVFRLPGTYNQKLNPPAPVTIIQDNPKNRFNPLNLTKWLDHKGIKAAPGPKKVQMAGSKGAGIVGYSLDLTASPDAYKLQALLAENRTFRKTWEHKRTASDMVDTSDSAYDLSLATLAYAAGWSDQEIINLIVFHRQTRQLDMKHPDYYELTLTKCKQLRDKEAVSKAAQHQFVQELEVATGAGSDVLAEVSELFGVQVSRWVKRMVDPPIYEIEIAGTMITVGNAMAVQNQSAVRSAVYSACDISIPKFKPALWLAIINKLGTVKEVIEPDPTETDKGLIHYWLLRYFNEKARAETFEEALQTDSPYKGKTGGFFILAKFKEFMSDHREIPRVGFSKALSDIGCTAGPHGTKSEYTRSGFTTKFVWQLPQHMLDKLSDLPN